MHQSAVRNACKVTAHKDEEVTAMIRRNARLRKEYIYRKSLEGTEREVYEKKRKIKDALASM